MLTWHIYIKDNHRRKHIKSKSEFQPYITIPIVLADRMDSCTLGVFYILKSISEYDVEVTIGEIAEKLNISPIEVHNALFILEDQRIIKRYRDSIERFSFIEIRDEMKAWEINPECTYESCYSQA